MPKLPFIQFYPADYLRDTRCLSLAARGVWMDVLCALWNAPKRGQKTLSLEGWAGEIGKPESEVSPLLLDLESNGIGKFFHETDGKLTISSRRMMRDERMRKGAAKRKKNQRDKCESRMSHTVSHGNVTGIYHTSEVILHKSEEDKEEEKRAVRVSRKRSQPRPPDDEWLEELQKQEAYQHLNVKVVFQKCSNWYKEKNRICTRLRFLAWLNKEPSPMNVRLDVSGTCESRVHRGNFLKPCGLPAVATVGNRPICQQHKEAYDVRRSTENAAV